VGVFDEGWVGGTRGFFARRPPRAHGGEHGYDTDATSMHALFVAAGPAFRRGLVVPPFTNVHVYDLVCRIREHTGISFGPHTFRHTYATELLRRGVAVEVVAKLLGHASIATTSDAYAHLKIEDARRALVAAGWLADQDQPR